jgi:serine/threonine protein kinase
MRLKQSWTAVSETFEGTKFGRYILLDEIGSGGMAKIYRAKTFGAAGFEKEFALKLILPSLVDDAEFVDMFINEAKIVVNLYHANIVQVFDLGEIDGQYYIAMEYVSGQDLLDILARCAKENIKIPLDLGLFMVMETLKGLNFAHNASDPYGNPLNIIHRDVTPSNVMISYGGDVKIGDFGVAQAAREKKVDPNDGPLKGKVEYMSPEQVTGNGVDARSDIFSAGIVLFEVLTQSRLFVGNSDLEVMMKVRDAEVDKRFEESSDIPPSLEKIARKALAKEPEDRFETASEFYQALVDFCYRHDIHIRDRDLSNFMQRLFSDEIEADRKSVV